MGSPNGRLELAGVCPDLNAVLSNLEERLRDCTYAGIDPFDGLSATRLPRLARGRRRSRQAVVQLFRRSPVDLRPLLGMPPRRMAKALGVVASGYAFLADAGWQGPARERASGLLDWLQAPSAHGADPRAWGYEFDVQTRWAFYLDLAAGLPVTTLTFADCVSSMAATFKVVESLTTGAPVDLPEVTAT